MRFLPPIFILLGEGILLAIGASSGYTYANRFSYVGLLFPLQANNYILCSNSVDLGQKRM